MTRYAEGIERTRPGDIGEGRGGQRANAAHSGHAKEIITRLKKVNEGPNS